jgi:hypothetical protein
MGILFGLILLSLLLAMLVATPLFAYRRAIHLLAREGAGTIAYGPGSGVPAVFPDGRIGQGVSEFPHRGSAGVRSRLFRAPTLPLHVIPAIEVPIRPPHESSAASRRGLASARQQPAP